MTLAIASSDSADNTFERNDFRYNVEIDCANDSIGTGTAGTAHDLGDPTTNLGFNDSPDGICFPVLHRSVARVTQQVP
ncbi:MAG: hypothetical protein QFC55_06285 [Chloroflexota bacterium]|nr:hypothetical protein [Chloroflexota bacterium]